MRYTEFNFKNFKGIRELVLPITGDVTTLIGLNESGKTTILKAIFCFSYGAENLDVLDPSMASIRIPESWIPISLRGNFNDSIEIGATVQLDSDDQDALAAYMLEHHHLRVADIRTELAITEEYWFENSRLRSSSKSWSLDLIATKGRQRKPREYGADTEEWQAAVRYLKTRLPSIWYFPNFLFELP